mmetsp:Transcript_12909/g.18430  ORF Transcript_12909/g.18430 Transcript_12909/m.18430 type:complete len:233 (+) Transcript_12909:149-847(+)|eukprot:CAMPEP_0184868584 /NCGR_PEP_ID=MMETSP0580-20130426/30955_1 /TAXON_ID=1118495 /ORGANISM="Dactyliosolen fragilissimus" /LENGTH=232 /DNA_ID=CAMNT_0027369569 /DNA_START=42 /DNA_END=740 /DNA_ORIENTATION=+
MATTSSTAFKVLNFLLLSQNILISNILAFTPQVQLCTKTSTKPPIRVQLHMSNEDHNHLREQNDPNEQNRSYISNSSRRSMILNTLCASTSSILLLQQPIIANAKSDDEGPSIEDLKAAFDAVRYELESEKGGISYELQQMVDDVDYERILEFTKMYDLEYRKAKMSKARKMISDKAIKENGLFFCNSVTFDLIGMNKNSRSGKEDIVQVRKYFEELKSDVKSFLDLEKELY